MKAMGVGRVECNDVDEDRAERKKGAAMVVIIGIDVYTTSIGTRTRRRGSGGHVSGWRGWRGRRRRGSTCNTALIHVRSTFTAISDSWVVQVAV